MLAYPDTRLYYEPEDRDPQQDLLTDWIEASVAFAQESISVSDVVDVMTENVSDKREMNPDTALEYVEMSWGELARRQALMGAQSPFRVNGSRVNNIMGWEDAVAHSFCMASSLQQLYSKWHATVNPDYQRRGALFERLCAESLRSWGWNVVTTGWAPDYPVNLPQMARELAREINETYGDVERWANKTARDEGLDLAAWMPFPDARTAKPLLLGQCTTRKHWKDKIAEPNLPLWQEILLVRSMVQRVFAIPFALKHSWFERIALRHGGMILDRYRVVSPRAVAQSFVSPGLAEEIVEYLGELIPRFPLGD